MTIHYKSPLDETQFSSVAEQINAQKERVKKTVPLSKAVSLSAIILFSVNLLILVVSLIYGAVAIDAESAASAEKLAGIPIVGKITHWCFEKVLLEFKDLYAILWSVVFLIAAPILVSVLIRIVGGLIIRNSASAPAGESVSNTNETLTAEKLGKNLSELKSLLSSVSGVKPAKTFSFLVCLFLVGYFFYGAYLSDEMDAFLNGNIGSILIGMAICVVILFFVFILLINIFMACIRPVYSVMWSRKNRALMTNLNEYEKRQLELLSTDELCKKAYELPLWDEKAVMMMEIAAKRGDKKGKDYLSEYKIYKEEQDKERMSRYYKYGVEEEAKGNYSSAKSWYRSAADMGHPDGMYNFARLAYKDGNVSDAKRYLKKSIDSGYYNDEHTRALLRAMESGQHINIV